MKTLLIVGLFHSVAFADNVWWQQSTTGNYRHSIKTQFENLDDNDLKNICAVIEPTTGLIKALTAKQQAEQGTAEGFKTRRAYRHKVHEQKVLCMSRYNNGRKILPMFSYFDGERAYRVHCQLEDDDFVCYDRLRYPSYLPAKHLVLENSGDLVAKITQLNYRQLTDDGRVFRLKINYGLKTNFLSSRQRIFFPRPSKEHHEYHVIDGNPEQIFTNIKTAGGKAILPICRIHFAENTIRDDSFAQQAICLDGLGGTTGYCDDSITTIKVCKAEGRGIMIKQDDGTILRVANCEYQPEAMHFYCSGKLENDQTVKVYFERYDVNVVEKKETTKCPSAWFELRNTAYVEELTCTKQLLTKNCQSFPNDINQRCKGKIPETGCNFYSDLQVGKNCPTVDELIKGLGCSNQSRHDDSCDFRYYDASWFEDMKVKSLPTTTIPSPNVEGLDETVDGAN